MRCLPRLTAMLGLVLGALPATASGQQFAYIAAATGRFCNAGCQTTTVYVVNTETGAIAGRFYPAEPGGDSATYRLAATPDGRKIYAFVVRQFFTSPFASSFQRASRIVPIDLVTQTVLSGIPIEPGAGTLDVAMAREGKRLYLGDGSAGILSVLDTSTDTIVRRIAVGGNFRTMAISPSGTRLYLLDASGGAIRVVDTGSMAVLTTFNGGANPVSMAVGPDGLIHVFGGTTPMLTSLREADGGVVRTIALAAPTSQAVLNPAGTTAFVLASDSADPSSGLLEIISLSTGTSVSVQLPGAYGLEVTHDGSRVLVLQYRSGRPSPDHILTVDGTTGEVLTTAALTVIPTAALVDMIAAPVPYCGVLEVEPSKVIVDRAGGVRTLQVRAPAGCPWTVENDSSSIVLSPTLGSGPGTIMASVPAGTAGMATTVRVNGRRIEIQRAIPKMVIDTPSEGAVTTQPFTLGGWAVDDIGVGPLVTGAGVNAVHLWAFPLEDGPPRFVAATNSRSWVTRNDVSRALGPIGFPSGSHYDLSGFNLPVSGLPPGRWRLAAYAFSTRSNAFNNVATVDVTIEPRVSRPAMVVDSPREGDQVKPSFLVAGWAVDRAALSGTGVDVVHVWAYPDGGAAPVFIGAASYALRRPDVATYFGDTQFDPSGFALVAQGIAPGKYTLVAFARSTFTGEFSIAQTVRITVHGASAF
jgi:DNA-binding beta-propeller fold protein YncE